MSGNKAFFAAAIVIIILCIFSVSSLDAGESFLSESDSAYYSSNPCITDRPEALQTMPELYKTGQLDSIQKLVDYWYNKCGGQELTRIRFLLDIHNDRFDDSEITWYTFSQLGQYAGYAWLTAKDTAYRRAYAEYGEFDTMTIGIARRLLERQDLSPSEEFICRVYTADTTVHFDELLGEKYNGTRLQMFYNSRADYYYSNDIPMIFSAGAWIPTGERSGLGFSPGFGIAMGIDWYRTGFFIGAFGWFGRTSDSRVFFNSGGVSSKLEVVAAEGQFVYKFWRNYPHEFLSTFTLGSQWLGSPGKKKFSILGGLGVSYRYYKAGYGHSDGSHTLLYYGIESRLEFSRIESVNGTNLSGVVIAIRLLCGYGGL